MDCASTILFLFIFSCLNSFMILIDLFDLRVIIPRYSLPSPLNKISSSDSFNLKTFFNLNICLEEGVIISLVDSF